MLKKKEFHNGLDIAVDLETEVVAVRRGVVTEVNVSSTYGKYMKYQTDDGYTIMYAHLSAILMEEGMYFEKGQVVAHSGNSGLSTGAHLHYSIWKDNAPADPMRFVDLPRSKEVDDEYSYRNMLINFVENK